MTGLLPPIEPPRQRPLGWRAVMAVLLVLLTGGIVWLVVSGESPRQSLVWDDPDDARSFSPELRRLLASEPLPVVEPLEIPALPPQEARQINASVPFASGANPPARPFVLALQGVERERAIDCLTSALWYEAGTDWEGQRAVAQVVLNRLRHPAFPKSVCAVVYQGQERRTGCQFTFTCDGALARSPPPWAWERSRFAAMAALDGAVYRPVGLATHYHTDWVVPRWSAKLDKIAAVRTHLFFRWRGNWGTLAAFGARPAGNEMIVARLAFLSAAHRAQEASEQGAVVEAAADSALIPGATASGSPFTARDPAIREPMIDPALLRGHRLTASDSVSGIYLLTLGSGPAGSHAMAALALCGEKQRCKVMGWTGASSSPRALPLDRRTVASAAFLYERQNGQEHVRWDCGQVPQAPRDKCLSPGSGWDTAGR